MWRHLALYIVSLLVIVLLLLLSACTPKQRANCGFCKATGLCVILGDDPNAGTPYYTAPVKEIK